MLTKATIHSMLNINLDTLDNNSYLYLGKFAARTEQCV